MCYTGELKIYNKTKGGYYPDVNIEPGDEIRLSLWIYNAKNYYLSPYADSDAFEFIAKSTVCIPADSYLAWADYRCKSTASEGYYTVKIAALVAYGEHGCPSYSGTDCYDSRSVKVTAPSEPEVIITDFHLNKDTAMLGETVYVYCTLQNTGGASAYVELRFTCNGTTFNEYSFYLDPDETITKTGYLHTDAYYCGTGSKEICVSVSYS